MPTLTFPTPPLHGSQSNAARAAGVRIRPSGQSTECPVCSLRSQRALHGHCVSPSYVPPPPPRKAKQSNPRSPYSTQHASHTTHKAAPPPLMAFIFWPITFFFRGHLPVVELSFFPCLLLELLELLRFIHRPQVCVCVCVCVCMCVCVCVPFLGPS